MDQHIATEETATDSTSRRNFIRLAVIAAGASLLGGLPSLPAHAAGHTDALLLTCMDFRLMDDVERYMSGRGLRDKYDHVILAGAALGAVSDKYPNWNATFWDHLGLAISLHEIHEVIVIDHRDCGAYKLILGEDLGKDPKKETEVHRSYLEQLAKQIETKHPGLHVERLLMNLDGKVEKVP